MAGWFVPGNLIQRGCENPGMIMPGRQGGLAIKSDRLTKEQTALVLLRAEAGTRVNEVCGNRGNGKATDYHCMKR